MHLLYHKNPLLHQSGSYSKYFYNARETEWP